MPFYLMRFSYTPDAWARRRQLRPSYRRRAEGGTNAEHPTEVASLTGFSTRKSLIPPTRLSGFASRAAWRHHLTPDGQREFPRHVAIA